MEAKVIMERLASVYSDCISYQDTGFASPVGQDKISLPFKTFFKRPEQFRFDWNHRHQQDERSSIIWSSGRYSYKGENMAPLGGVESILHAAGMACVASIGAASIVPSLLIDPMGESTIVTLGDLENVGETDLDGLNCYIIKGSSKRMHDTTLWVAQSVYRLCRVQREVVITAEESEELFEQAVTILAQHGRDLSLARSTIAFRKNRFVRDYSYKEVRFNEPIDPILFERI